MLFAKSIHIKVLELFFIFLEPNLEWNKKCIKIHIIKLETLNPYESLNSPIRSFTSHTLCNDNQNNKRNPQQ